jgi:hypothetical protein
MICHAVSVHLVPEEPWMTMARNQSPSTTSSRMNAYSVHPTLPESYMSALFGISSGSSSNRKPFVEKIMPCALHTMGAELN